MWRFTRGADFQRVCVARVAHGAFPAIERNAGKAISPPFGLDMATTISTFATLEFVVVIFHATTSPRGCLVRASANIRLVADVDHHRVVNLVVVSQRIRRRLCLEHGKRGA